MTAAYIQRSHVQPVTARRGLPGREVSRVAHLDDQRRRAIQGAPYSPTLQTNSKVVYRCAYRVLWCTQYRMPVIDAEIANRLKALVVEVAEEKGASIKKLRINPVTVDMVLEVDPQLGIHRFVKAMKSRSAGVLRREFPSLRSRIPSLWTNAYFVNTIGGEVPEKLIQQFITEQPKR